MDKVTNVILKISLLISTTFIVYSLCVDLYPLVMHDYTISKGNYFLSELCQIIIWFALLCILVHKKQMEFKILKLPYKGRESQMVFILPFVLVLMNIVLAFITFLVSVEDLWRFSIILTEANCLLFVFLVIAIIFFVAIQYNIIIWYPISLFCAIYVIPTGAYSDELGTGLVVIVMMVGIIVFGFIEYGIMLFLNRKKWYIPKNET